MKAQFKAWHDDTLDRKDEAFAVAEYLVARSIARRKGGRRQGFVMAVDAEYGEGKSYFIQNLKAQLSSNHPVALIDAWVDDRTREPFLAILDALENALEPFFDKSSSIREKSGKLIESAGPLMSGIATGVAKKFFEKAAGTGSSGLVRDALDANVEIETLENSSRRSEVTDISEDAGSIAEHGIAQGIARVERLADGTAKAALLDFRRSKQSALRLKSRLTQIVDNIDAAVGGKSSPIFIFIDELDRCRPTYAIALLEEIKHLFDVAGVVFVLAIHRDQLLSSIRSVYGNEFDAARYLDRFIDKAYRLSRPTSVAFVEAEFAREPFADGKFLDDALGQSVANRVGQVFDQYGLTLREMERAIDSLRGCAALTGRIAIDPIFLATTILQGMGKSVHEPHSLRESSHSYKLTYIRQVSYQGTVTQQHTGEATLKDVIFRVSQMGGWDFATVLQEKFRDRRNVDEEYAFQQISRFYAQFPKGFPEALTQQKLCIDALQRFKPFATNEGMNKVLERENE